MKDNENNKGYILFNADGTKPKATFAALMTDDGTQIIAEGKVPNFLSMIGSLARSLVNECDVPKNILLTAIDAAMLSGDAWEGIMDMMSKKPSDDTVDKIMDMFTQD